MQVCKQQTANGKSRSMKCCDVRKDISKCGQSPLTNAEFGIWLKAQKYSDEKYAAKRNAIDTGKDAADKTPCTTVKQEQLPAKYSHNSHTH